MHEDVAPRSGFTHRSFHTPQNGLADGTSLRGQFYCLSSLPHDDVRKESGAAEVLWPCSTSRVSSIRPHQ